MKGIDSTMVENILVFLYKRLTKTSVSALVELVEKSPFSPVVVSFPQMWKTSSL